VAVRGVVETHDGEHAVDADARGPSGHEDDGLAFIDVFVRGVGLVHYDEELAVRGAGAAGPPFLGMS
jgi:hypothetical protein